MSLSTASGPKVITQPANGIEALSEFLRNKTTCVLTGAGISTDSGIPDYRGPKTRHIKRNPTTHDQFVTSAELRQRYWARASRGYAAVRGAKPNQAHYALTKFQELGLINGVITQNVDGLHSQAGSTDVTELHGSLHHVICLDCGHGSSRSEVQQRIEANNPGWLTGGVVFAPDGDADINEGLYRRFNIPTCPACNGEKLMPDVVFFGGRVPKDRVEASRRLVETADALLVIGSSLTVYSGYRFAKFAHRAARPIALLSLGETRADPLATLKLDVPLIEVLPQTAKRLS